ncbi:MAG: hypothetical protein AB7P20_08770 [Rhizobiaceae bacterium]
MELDHLTIVLILIFMLAYFVSKAAKDYRFYYKNGWSYDEDSGVALLNGDMGLRMTPQQRLFIGHPLMAGSMALCVVVLAF